MHREKRITANSPSGVFYDWRSEIQGQEMGLQWQVAEIRGKNTPTHCYTWEIRDQDKKKGLPLEMPGWESDVCD